MKLKKYQECQKGKLKRNCSSPTKNPPKRRAIIKTKSDYSIILCRTSKRKESSYLEGGRLEAIKALI